MTDNDARLRSPAPLTIAGIALIVIPIIAVIVKIASFGWLLVLALWTLYVPALLGLGWLLQIVIASTGYFGRRAFFADRRGARRAVVAAWTTSIGVVLFALLLVDGGDMSWGSTLMYWTGTQGDDGLGAVSSTLAWIAMIPWLGGWVWLVVEWVVAIGRRGREVRAARGSQPS